jgi:hypothetical protein
LLAKISAVALDLLPDNHPGVDPASVYFQITALRDAESSAAWWLRSLIVRSGSCCALPDALLVCQGM